MKWVNNLCSCKSSPSLPAQKVGSNIFFLWLGADMDLCLENYGYCNFVSSKQSTTFYDEVEQVQMQRVTFLANLIRGLISLGLITLHVFINILFICMYFIAIHVYILSVPSSRESNGFSPFQSGVAFVIETSDLICNANQMIGFYMKFNTGIFSV